LGFSFGLSSRTAWAGSDLRVQLEAKPSATCFPASSLQLPELEEDFARICKDCEFIRKPGVQSDFRIVVEDPGYSWQIKIYDRNNGLIKQLNWSGALDNGLQKASGFIHTHSSPN
jgi:hypothetical protein